VTYRIEQLGEDALEATARCHTACLQEAYAGIVPAYYLAQMTDLPTRTARWRARYEANVSAIYIAWDATGEVVGLSHAGPPRDDEPSLPPFELYTLYVRKVQYGSGLAQELIDVSVGLQPAFLWVYEQNPRARRFYERNGFVPSGRSKFDGDTGVLEITMVRR
jgi:GNAT superfamily N-acetyltransferase